eukprot:2777098-Pyramimonas_sp.AAC.1
MLKQMNRIKRGEMCSGGGFRLKRRLKQSLQAGTGAIRRRSSREIATTQAVLKLNNTTGGGPVIR